MLYKEVFKKGSMHNAYYDTFPNFYVCLGGDVIKVEHLFKQEVEDSWAIMN